jgi:hypothetical protein
MGHPSREVGFVGGSHECSDPFIGPPPERVKISLVTMAALCFFMIAQRITDAILLLVTSSFLKLPHRVLGYGIDRKRTISCITRELWSVWNKN